MLKSKIRNPKSKTLPLCLCVSVVNVLRIGRRCHSRGVMMVVLVDANRHVRRLALGHGDARMAAADVALMRCHDMRSGPDRRQRERAVRCGRDAMVMPAGHLALRGGGGDVGLAVRRSGGGLGLRLRGSFGLGIRFRGRSGGFGLVVRLRSRGYSMLVMAVVMHYMNMSARHGFAIVSVHHFPADAALGSALPGLLGG